MRFWLNLFLVLVIIVAVGNFIKRFQDRKQAQFEAAKETSTDIAKPGQLTQEQMDLIKQANTVPKDYTPVPTMTGSHSRLVEGQTLYKYLAYLPHGYYDNENKDKKYPVIVYLHGQGGKGTDPKTLASAGPVAVLQNREDPNFICVAPLCPPGGGWMSDPLDELLGSVIERFRVDTDRLYLTGISMGGHGTWSWAQDHPKRWAAIAPLCGAGSPKKAKLRLKHMPIWIFHGALDETVPVERAESVIRVLRPVNENLRVSIFPDQGHGIGAVYQSPALYVWFLTNSKDPKKSILYEGPDEVESATDTVDSATPSAAPKN